MHEIINENIWEALVNERVVSDKGLHRYSDHSKYAPTQNNAAAIKNVEKTLKSNSTGWAKNVPLLLTISSPVIDQFSKFFHWHTADNLR